MLLGSCQGRLKFWCMGTESYWLRLRYTALVVHLFYAELSMWRALMFTVGILVSAGLPATTVVQFSFDSLCETSAKVAHVTCIESEPVKTAEGIRMRTRFRVMEGVKGEVGEEIEILLPGGQLDGRRVYVAGIPSFTPGRETVLFLSGPDGIGSPWPVGLGQGCYRVTSSEKGRRVHLQHGTTPIPDGALHKPASEGPYQVDLKAFLRTIRETTGVTASSEK